MSEGGNSERQAGLVGCDVAVGVAGMVMLGLILAVCVGVLRWW
jgi:hypothetical protein